MSSRGLRYHETGIDILNCSLLQTCYMLYFIVDIVLSSHVFIVWQAWDLQPEKRPSFHDIKVTLGQLRAEYTKGVN